MPNGQNIDTPLVFEDTIEDSIDAGEDLANFAPLAKQVTGGGKCCQRFNALQNASYHTVAFCGCSSERSSERSSKMDRRFSIAGSVQTTL
jgi:hypothetical protein